MRESVLVRIVVIIKIVIWILNVGLDDLRLLFNFIILFGFGVIWVIGVVEKEK